MFVIKTHFMKMLLGSGEFLYSFFSSVSVLLEKDGWGTRFPYLLRHLCDYGVVKYENVDELEREIMIIKKELQKYKITQAVYDYQYPNLDIPFDKTEYYDDNSNLDEAYCVGEEKYGYELITNKILTTIKDSRKYKAPIELTFAFFGHSQRKGMYVKCGRGILKGEYPIVFAELRGDVDERISKITQPEAAGRIKMNYDKQLAKLKEKVPITYYWYIVDGLENYTEEDFQKLKIAFEQILQTDYFKFIFIDKNTPEEDPSIPLKY